MGLRPLSSELCSLTFASNHMGNLSKLAIDSRSPDSTVFKKTSKRNRTLKLNTIQTEIDQGLHRTNIGIAKSLVKLA